MTLNELIELSASASGSLKQLAADMGKHQNRLTEWKKGTHKPDADEIAFLARNAGLPVIQTIADIESQLNSRYAEVWREALGKLTAAGIAASVIGAVTLSPSQANAAQYADRTNVSPSVYYVNRLKRALRRFLALRMSRSLI